MQKSYNGLSLPQGGEVIQYAAGKYQIPDHPIIPFIEGDGTGRDIWRASQRIGSYRWLPRADSFPFFLIPDPGRIMMINDECHTVSSN